MAKKDEKITSNIVSMRPSKVAQALDFCLSKGLSVMLVGSPGCGKTSLLEQCANRLGQDLLIFHPVVSDPTDFKGLPFVVAGNAEFLPYGDLRRVVEAKKPTIVFLDDLGQSTPAVQAATMQLILARHINGVRIPDCVTFVAATNRRTDKAGVTGILEPLKGRFHVIIQVEPNKDDFIVWAIEHGMPPELIAFTNYKPSFLTDFEPTNDMTNSPTPRTIAHVGDLMNAGLVKNINFQSLTKKSGKDIQVDLSFEHALISGAAGQGYATEFVAFVRTYKSLPDLELICKDPDSVPIPDINRPDVLYAICGALAHRAEDKVFENIMKYVSKFPQEYQVLFVRDASRFNEKLLNNKTFVDWAVKHKDLLIG